MVTTAQPRLVKPPTVPRPFRPVLRLETTLLTVVLLTQMVLGAATVAFVSFTSGDPRPAWLLDVHAAVGALSTLLAIALLVGSARARDGYWVVRSAVVLGSLLVAFACGDRVVRTDGQAAWASFLMAVGAVVALGVCVRLLVTTRGSR